MTDKRDEVVAAARIAWEEWKRGEKTVQAMHQLRDALAALDSPLPSDEKLRDVALDAFNKRRESFMIGDEMEPAQEAARQAICAYSLRLAANHIGVRSELVVAECVEAIDKLADAMENRSG